jgi:HpiC1 cyclase
MKATLWAAVPAVISSLAGAAPLTIPNASFESPPTTYAVPFVDFWQQMPQPDLTNQATLVTGVFSNSPPGDPTHIDNCDGNQALFLFAVPETAVFQDYDSSDYAHPVPTHAFDASYDVGKAYTLTVAVLGGTNLAIPMQEGTTLQLSLYYRDGASNLVTVAALSITNSGSLFPSATQFVDFQVQAPVVKASDPWAGQHIGIELLSTVDPSLIGGYWDLDNVRLSSTVAPALASPAYTNGHFSFALQSEPGLAFEVLASEDIAQALSNWTSLGTVTNVTGTAPFTDPTTGLSRRFYRARQLP